jgi:hypothetical protein
MLVFAGGVGLPAPALASDPLDGASAALNYQCTLPIVGDQPVFANLRSNIPSYWTGSVLSPSFQVQLEARLKGDTFLGMQVVGASPGGSLLGKGKADSPLAGGALLKARFLFPSGAGTTSTLPVSIPLTVPQSPLPEADPGDAGLPLSASGQTPRITLPGPGSAQVFIDSLAMSLQARDATGAPIDGLGDPTDSDGDPSTFDIPCTGNSQKLADITVPAVGTPTGTPVPPTPTPLPPTPTPTPYFGTPTPNVPTPTPTPLPPTPTPIVGTPVPPTPLPPTPTGLVELPPMHYTVAGKAYLKTLASGSVPMAGTMTVQHLRLSDGSASVPTTFAPTTAKLNALRLLPITASLTFTEVGETRGKLTQNGISFTTNQVIRLKNAKVFGVNLVTSTCVTSAPAVIPLKSPATGFKLSGGGALTGTFTIPSFKSCGVLTSLVTGLAAGSGNGISLTATPAGV